MGYFHLNLSKTEEEQLARAAFEQHRTKTAIVRVALMRYFKELENEGQEGGER